jgi:carbamoyltransferase
MIIVGLNAYHGDVSAVVLRDGQLLAAVEEERFTRVKHTAGFPRQAIASCLAAAGVEARDVDVFAVSRNPRAHLARKAWFLLRNRPRGLMADRARNFANVRAIADPIAAALGLDRQSVAPRVRFVEHHPAHLASAFYVSPFDEAAVCAIDGFGDFVSTSWGVGRGGRIAVRHRTYFPHSLGLVYLAVTQYLGFPRYGDEFKVMGLAPYGEPAFANELRQLIRLRDGGAFELDLSYFRHWSDGVAMTWTEGEPAIGPVFTPKLAALLGPARAPSDPIEPRHEAIAASLQQVYEEAAFHVLDHVQRTTRQSRLCLAGGCAMNSVANGKIRERTAFREVYIQPAAGDNGTALGAAYTAWHAAAGDRRFVMDHALWGPSFTDSDVTASLDDRRQDLAQAGCLAIRHASDAALCRWTAGRIAEGLVVGWYQGRMEWGARALGNRSIVADPRRRDMRDIINTRIKFREKFRPFAPSILEDRVDEYFVGAVPDPFMIQVYPVRPEKRGTIPAVTHVDGSGRLQTVSRRSNPLYWGLIDAFAAATGVPILLNTSFNENEPIVLTPSQALDCFLRTRMDILVLGRHVLQKADVAAAVAAGGLQSS